MHRLAPELFVPLVVLVLAGQAAALVWVSGPSMAGSPTGAELLSLGVSLLVVLAVGRLVLSLLPAGRPGSHAPRELSPTLATSLALGSIALELEGRLLTAWHAPGWVWPTPWLLLLALRLVTLPGGLVPGRAPDRERRPWLADALHGLAFALTMSLVWLAWTEPAPAPAGLAGWSPSPRLGDLSWLAVLVLIDLGLRAADRHPLGRAVCLLFVALAIPYGSAAPLSATLGLVFLIPWLRRADRRGLALASLGFLGVALDHEAWLALVGLGLVLLGARRAQSKDAFRAIVVPASFAVAVALGESGLPSLDALGRVFVAFPFWGLPLAASLLALPLVVRAVVRNADGEAPVREAAVIASFFLLALVNAGFARPTALLGLLPAMVLVVGLAWGRPLGSSAVRG